MEINRREFIGLSGMTALGLFGLGLEGLSALSANAQGGKQMDMYIRDFIPPFLDDYVKQMKFPLSFADNHFTDFAAWKKQARAKAMELVSYDLAPAPGWDMQVLNTEDRGSYTQQKITFAINKWYRVPAYLLVPKGHGPFPAVVACHDHGAFFLYGKEKLVATEADANPGLAAFKQECYGGRSIANVLAERGYVVIVIDGLFWGERASRGFGEDQLDLNTAEGVQKFNALAYDTAGAISANLLNAGLSWCGILVGDDLRTARFLASLPMVDKGRIGCCGLSVGCFRSWHLAALSDIIGPSVNICWMTTVQSQLLERCNLSTSIGAMSMIIPTIMRYMDYSDFASMAAPKPALFFNGLQDGLFPVHSVETAYAKMQKVWNSQGAGSKLYHRLWDVPHTFNAPMQDDAFNWLDKYLTPPKP